jgi:hypothetical protein
VLAQRRRAEGAAWEGEGVGAGEGGGSVFDFVIDGIDGAFFFLVFIVFNFSPFLFSFFLLFLFYFVPMGVGLCPPHVFPLPLCLGLWYMTLGFRV